MARYEVDDFEEDERLIVKTPGGRAALLPKSAGRLEGEALEIYADMMGVGVQVAELEQQLVQLVAAAREENVSWALIGAAVGLTSEGARRRYA